MRVLMLVATSVATDTRVLREATTLSQAGHQVHIIGRSVPQEYQPPAGITVSSVGTSSVFRAEGSASLSGRRLPPHLRVARWVLLPRHRQSAFGRWSDGAVRDGLTRQFDVVHAHDFTALSAGVQLAQVRAVPLIYDSHELWLGRPREYRPTPLLNARERAREARWGAKAAAVITVGDGIAEALRQRYGWTHIVVVRNTFPQLDEQPRPTFTGAPHGLIYAGRIAAYRELETIAEASRTLDLPVTLMGPADQSWLAGFDPGKARIEPACPPDEVDAHLARAGLVLVTHSDRWENHRLAMPNKLFHAIRAGVPVVATDVGELAKVVRRYAVGTLYPPGDAVGLVEAVHRAVQDYPSLLAAVRAAAPELSWTADAQRLLEVYAGLERSAEPTQFHSAETSEEVTAADDGSDPPTTVA